ncbi:MAG: hypothetical protein JKY93_04385 [Gammaproteobacteria bacterium]|nr:hypothetical protein [Gammaproteobacteria bacterium]
MKRLILLILPFFVAANANAYEITYAADLYRFGYKEFDDAGVLLDREDGFVPGAKFSVRKNINHLILNGRAAVYGGSVDYDGQTQVGTPFQTTTDTNLFHFGADLGYSFKHFDLYGTATYKLWERNILPGKDVNGGSVSGLKEDYSWWEFGVKMIKTISAETNNNKLRLGAEIFTIVQPELDVHLLGFDTAKLEMASKRGYRLTADHIWPMSQELSFALGTYYEFYEFGRSKNVQLTVNGTPSGPQIYEPKSETSSWGFNLSATQRF